MASPLKAREAFEGKEVTSPKRNFVVKKKKRVLPAAPEDEKELTEKFKSMSNNTKNKKQAKRLGRNKDAIETLLGSLNRNPKFTKMVEYSVECLGNLATDKASVDEMIEEGVLDALQRVLKLNPYNEKIQRIINRALQAFMVDDQTADKVTSTMGAKPMVHSLNKHVEVDTIESSTATTATMMRLSPPEVTESFVRDGMLPALASIIHHHGDNEKIMANVAENLDLVAKSNQECAKEVMKANVVEGILTGLTEFPDNEKYVLHSVGLFGSLARANPESLQELKRMGAVDIIVSALEMHADNEEILELGSHALSAMAGDDDIEHALKVKTGNDTATAQAMSKISSLLLVPENVDFMIRNEGISWLIAALKAVVGEEGKIPRNILMSGTRALQRLAADEGKIYQLIKDGGVKLLLSIMGNHATDEEVATGALKALTNMVTRKENADFIEKSGGIEASQAVLAQHPESVKVAKHMEQFIQALAKHPEIVERLVAKNAHKSCVDILTEHGADSQVARLGINTLGRMAVSAEHMEAIAEAGGMEALVHILRSHPEDLAIAKQTMLMMESAAQVPQNVERLRDAGAVEAVLMTIELHPEDEQLQQIGAKLAARLAKQDEMQVAVDSVKDNIKEVDKLVGAVKMLGHLALVDDNAEQLTRVGGIEVLNNAFLAACSLESGSQKSDVMTTAVAGLLRLCASEPEHATALVQQSTLKKILTAALADPANEELAEMAAELAAVTAGIPANVEHLLLDGTCEDIIKLAQAHPLNEKALMASARALGLVAQTNPGASKRLVQGGAGEVVSEAMFANVENPEAILDALAVMKTLQEHIEGDETSVQKLVDAAAIDAILQTMRSHPGNAEILKACMSALCALLISEAVANTIGEKKGIPLCVAAMRQHFKDQDLEEVDMVLCDSLASSQANLDLFLDESLGTIDLVTWVAGKYRDNQVIEEAAANLLASLDPPKEEKQEELVLNQVLKAERVVLNEVSAKRVLARLTASAPGSDERNAVLVEMNVAIQADSVNSKLLLACNPFPPLAAIMKQDKDSEQIFFNASKAFLSLLGQGSDDTLEQVLDDSLCMESLCEVMKANERFATQIDIKDLQRAIGAVAKKKLKPGSVKQLLSSNPIASLMDILAHSDDPTLLGNTAKLLGKLSNDAEAVRLMTATANLRELINSMRRNITNEEFLQYGVYLLGNFAEQSEDLKKQIGIEGGIQLIMQIMDMYPENMQLIENCGFSLAALSYHEAINCSFITACKGIPILIRTMRNFPEATDLLEHCVIVLTNLCHLNDPNKEEIVKHDGAQVVVDCVLANFDTLDLVSACFRCLGNLSNNKHNIEAVIKAGAVQGLVAGMTVHAAELDIITIAIRVLTAMANEPRESNMVVMAEEGAVQAVVEVLQCYPDKTDLEIAATQCLMNLSKYPPNASMIVKQGGVNASMIAASTSGFDPKIVLKTLKLNQALTNAKDDLKLIIDDGCAPGILSILKAHGKARPVVGTGLVVLGKLCYSPEAATKVAKGDTIAGVLALLKLNMSDAGLVEECFKTLNLLSRSPENALAMAGPAFSLAVNAFQTHIAQAAVIRVVFQFLGNLVFHKPAAQLVPSKGGEVASGVLGLITGPYINDVSVLVRGCKALENLAFGGPECKDYLKKIDTLRGMETIKEKCEGLPEAVQAAQKVIDALAQAEVDVNLDFQDLAPRIEKHRDAKDIFGHHVEQEKKLSRDIRNMLVSGALLVKHSKTAQPRRRHVYVDGDLKYLVWKDPKEKKLDPKNKMKVFKIKTIERGRCTPQLQRKKWGLYLAKEECSFSITGRERTVDLEADTEEQREKWVHALETLIAYDRAKRLLAVQVNQLGVGHVQATMP